MTPGRAGRYACGPMLRTSAVLGCAFLSIIHTARGSTNEMAPVAGAPYHGPVTVGVDASTLTGKVMCGYQGWFGAAGDGSSPQRGWRHWTRRPGAPADGTVTVDLWPDVSELGRDELFATDLNLADGRKAEVFSSFKKPTVLRHFQWMRDYGIDGVFVQRFISGLRRPESLEHCDTVLANCREGANRFGRVYAVMYDLSGLGAGRIREVMDDWLTLRRDWQITQDPAYLHHRGKPVVTVWGVGFNDGRQYTLAECRQLVEFLKTDGCTVMLGVPAHWRQLKADAVSDPALLEVIQAADIVSPWTVGRYTNPASATEYSEGILAGDLAWCRERRIDYLPVVFPGFSWHNLKGGPVDQIPRRRGEFIWSQFCGDKRAGASMLYVAMFDEMDEGTAIFKCSNDVPVGKTSKFVTYDGLPGDFYLKLVGAGTKMLRGEIPLTDQLPSLK
jgi:hypothetical protein